MSSSSATALVVVAGLLVATVAAVRSTWSPCGLSMLSTLTPLGERARGHRYGSTAAWFVAGAATGGASLGLPVAGLAAAVGRLGPTPDARLWAAGGAALVAAVSDAGVARWRLPAHRRQVNERWLDGYRSWVYGAGFGWQIGAGVVTYITTAAVYLLVALAVLTGNPLVALALCAWFGLLRGLAVLLTRHLRSAADLLAFHRRFEAGLPRADRAVRAAELVVAVSAAAALARPAAALLLVVPALPVVAVPLVRRRSRPGGAPPSPRASEAVPSS